MCLGYARCLIPAAVAVENYRDPTRSFTSLLYTAELVTTALLEPTLARCPPGVALLALLKPWAKGRRLKDAVGGAPGRARKWSADLRQVDDGHAFWLK